MNYTQAAIKDLLDEKFNYYNRRNFIESDPISIPHQFTKKEDIEIAAFLSATIAWGQRKTILRNASRLMHWMDLDPHRFILNFTTNDLKPFRKFIHRTFQPDDCIFFLNALQNVYLKYGGLSKLFQYSQNGSKGKVHSLKDSIVHARSVFLELSHDVRNEKHFSNPEKGSAAKRINMFLRWMVRNDAAGVDFGIWKNISPDQLVCPLDVHSARVARKLKLLKRKQNDWQAAVELTESLKRFDPVDPVKYDFALFGLGVFEGF